MVQQCPANLRSGPNPGRVTNTNTFQMTLAWTYLDSTNTLPQYELSTRLQDRSLDLETCCNVGNMQCETLRWQHWSCVCCICSCSCKKGFVYDDEEESV